MTIVVLVLAIDLVVSLQVIGITYRPFSWMSLTPAEVLSLYPVIDHVTASKAGSQIALQAQEGAEYVLQRSTNLLDEREWVDVPPSTTATNNRVVLTDTNRWFDRAVFYRVKRVY